MNPMNPMKKIPKFKSEAEERAFWAAHDSTEYVDWKRAKRAVLPEPEAVSQDHLRKNQGRIEGVVVG